MNWGKLEERMDAEYYLPCHYRLIEALENSPHILKRLKYVTSHIVDGPFGSAIKASDYANEGIPFIRVADVTRGDGTIRTSDLIFITPEAHANIARSKVIKECIWTVQTHTQYKFTEQNYQNHK